jgi:subtilisin family serine protease
MRSFFIYLTIILFSGFVQAQSKLNAELLYQLSELKFIKKIEVLAIVSNDFSTKDIAAFDATFNYQVGNIISLTIHTKDIVAFSNLETVKRVEYSSSPMSLLGDTCMVRNRIKPIKTGQSPLTQSYDGEGVLVGIIDSGTDFNHPDFKDEFGKSRIRYLWDMKKPLAANTPTPFGYGQEWTNQDINIGACSHDDLGNFGHGSNSAGIAAGNGYSIGHFSGVASKADIMSVALDFGRGGNIIADAVKYLVQKADELNQPLVINASVGGYFGSHDGKDVQALLIDNLIANKPGRALVASAGNAGSIKFHLGYDLVPTDTNFTWIKAPGSIVTNQFYADTNNVKQMYYSVGVNNPAYRDLGRISFKPYNYALNVLKRDTIFYNTRRIGIVESVATINTYGVYELFVGVRADSLNYLWRLEQTGSGRMDSWNFNFVSSNLPSALVYPRISKYKSSDTLQTIVSSFQCSDEVITVGNYVNRNKYWDVNDNLVTTNEIAGQIAASSSNGPTRDNRVKPEVAASGASILAATAIGLLPNLVANAPSIVGKGGFHVISGGTSASSPVVAGLAALYFQKHPTATNRELKQTLINCGTYKDEFTTQNLPNSRWGYGKLDGFGALTCGMTPTGLINHIDNYGIKIYPNPMVNKTTIEFLNHGTKEIKVFSVSGQLLRKDVCSELNYELLRGELSPGIYFIDIRTSDFQTKLKLVVL